MTVRFEDRSRLLRKVIKDYVVSDGPFYLWAPSSELCGLYLIDSIHTINCSFAWDGEDIFSFTSIDLKEEMVLSWYEENDNALLDIMLYSSSKRFVKTRQKNNYVTPESEFVK